MREDANDRYVKGDNWLIDDRTGHQIRRSESRKEWTGAIVHKDEYEDRHPQDFKRGRRDDQTVRDPRPEPPAVFGGPKATTIAADEIAGDTSIEVVSTTGFTAADRVAVMLDNNTRHTTTVSSVTDGTHLVLAAALPWKTSIGQAVIDYTAITAVDIG